MNIKRIALNWLAFESKYTGAARRAFELHRRLSSDLKISAYVTGGFPDDWRESLPEIEFIEIVGERNFLSRINEGQSQWWKHQLERADCGLWVTDTLPVIRFGDIKTCITVHDLRFLEDRSYMSLKRYILMKATMKNSLKRADAVIAVSKYGGEGILENYPATSGKIHIIANAVESNMGSAKSTEETLPAISKPYILSVGHLEKRKNQDSLIRAFSIISGDWDGVLVLAGKDIGYGRELEAIAEKLGLSNRILFTGVLSQPELLSFYENCELVVCPSLMEGFGMTVLEGMAMEKPVIASDIPAHAEVAGDASLLVHAADNMVNGLAKTIVMVLKNSDIQNFLIRKGKERIQLYTWEKSASLLESLYRSLLCD